MAPNYLRLSYHQTRSQSDSISSGSPLVAIRTAPENELPQERDTGSNSPDSDDTDSHGNSRASSPHVRPTSRVEKDEATFSDILQTLFRALKLQLLYNAFWFKARFKKERPKRALRNIRWMVIFLLPTHLVAMGVTLAMILINTIGLYIGSELAGPSGDYDAIKFAGLQFAAKLHELLMQGSLSLAVIDIVRRELIGDGIPFGTLCAALGQDLMWLFSKELWGSLKGRYERRMRKVILILTIIVGIVLSNTVGPSTAILMRPQMGTWPAGGTSFMLNATHDQIWPTYVDASQVPASCANVSIAHRNGCPSDGWDVISENYLSFWSGMNHTSTLVQRFYLSSRTTLRLFNSRQRAGIYHQIASFGLMPMANLADALGEVAEYWFRAAAAQESRFRYREEVTVSIKNATQPIVEALCTSRYYDRSNYSQIWIPIPGSRCGGSTMIAPYSESDVVDKIWNRYSDDSVTWPTIHFADLSGSKQSYRNSSLGVFITLPASTAIGKQIMGCAIDARWSNDTMVVKRTNVMAVSSGQPSYLNDYAFCLAGDDLRKIRISPQWADYLNPKLQGTSTDVFQKLANAIPLDKIWNFEETAGNETEWYRENHDNWDSDVLRPYFESLLSSWVTNGLSMHHATAAVQGYLKVDWSSLLLPHGVFGYRFDSIYELPPGTDTSTMSRYDVHVDIEGYAYILRGTAVILSIVVLGSYVVFILAYIVLFLLRFRLWSTAWDSMSELTALAIQSPETSVLENTTAGIYTSGIYSNRVQVVQRRCLNGDLKLALHFPDAEDGQDGQKKMEKVIPGEYYH